MYMIVFYYKYIPQNTLKYNKVHQNTLEIQQKTSKYIKILEIIKLYPHKSFIPAAPGPPNIKIQQC